MKIYTRSGDEGYTTKYDGSKVRKDNAIIVLISKIDSLLGSLDSAFVVAKDEGIKVIIERIQDNLWQTAGEISLGGKGKKVKNEITQDDVDFLEKMIDEYNPENNFFVRFRTDPAARLNDARIKCRELEVALTDKLLKKEIRPEIYRYINRLSDLLYVLACKENK